MKRTLDSFETGPTPVVSAVRIAPPPGVSRRRDPGFIAAVTADRASAAGKVAAEPCPGTDRHPFRHWNYDELVEQSGTPLAALLRWVTIRAVEHGNGLTLCLRVGELQAVQEIPLWCLRFGYRLRASQHPFYLIHLPGER